MKRRELYEYKFIDGSYRLEDQRLQGMGDVCESETVFREVLPGDDTWQSTLSETCDEIEQLRSRVAELEAVQSAADDLVKAIKKYPNFDELIKKSSIPLQPLESALAASEGSDE